jgi:hypothetical protein
MINPGFAETFAEIHQHELRQQADRVRQRRAARKIRSRHHPIRTRAGWWMVHTGIRLALAGPHPDRRSAPVDYALGAGSGS